MTTNVFDGNTGCIATDSRWSTTWSKWLIYVDDVQFDKIDQYKSSAFMFAGQGLRIQEWKNWIRSAPTDGSNMPSCDGISVCIVDTAKCSVIFSERQDIVKDGAYFAGSGSRFAYVCWSKNKDAQRSVESAKQVDFYSGGEVKYVDAKNGVHNLHLGLVDVTIDMVTKALETRGNVMEIGTGAPTSGIPFKLSDLAANDTEMKAIQAKIANGDLRPEAPCDGMYSEWTAEQTSRLKTALASVFSWK